MICQSLDTVVIPWNLVVFRPYLDHAITSTGDQNSFGLRQESHNVNSRFMPTQNSVDTFGFEVLYMILAKPSFLRCSLLPVTLKVSLETQVDLKIVTNMWPP